MSGKTEIPPGHHRGLRGKIVPLKRMTTEELIVIGRGLQKMNTSTRIGEDERRARAAELESLLNELRSRSGSDPRVYKLLGL